MATPILPKSGPVYLLAVLPPLFWAGNFILGKLVSSDIPPVQLSFFRWTIACLILTSISWQQLKPAFAMIKIEIKFLLVFSLLGVTAFNSLIYMGLNHTSAVNAALINSSMPVMTFVFSIVLLKDRVDSKHLSGIALAIIGIAFIISKGDYRILLNIKLNQGDSFIFLAVCCWAMYTVLIKRWPSKLPPLVFLTTIATIGSLLHFPFIFIEAQTRGVANFTPFNVFALMYLAIFPSILAYLFWGKAIQQLGPAKASLFMYLMPIFSVILAFFILNEQIKHYQLIGFSLVIIGLSLVNSRH